MGFSLSPGSVFPSGASPSQAGLGLEVPGACSPLPGSKLKWFRFESSLQCGGTCWLRTPIPCHYDVRPEERWALPGWGKLGATAPVNPEGLLLPRAHPDGWSWAQVPSQQPSTGSLSGRSHNPSHNCVASDLPSWRQNSNLPSFSSGSLLTKWEGEVEFLHTVSLGGGNKDIPHFLKETHRNLPAQKSHCQAPIQRNEVYGGMPAPWVYFSLITIAKMRNWPGCLSISRCVDRENKLEERIWDVPDRKE
nr:uncharacterized protein LOC105464582 [Macaca nemestrina]